MNPRRLLLSVLAVALLTATAVLAVVGREYDQRHADADRQGAAVAAERALRSSLGETAARVSDLAGLYESSRDVSPAEHRRFARRLMRDTQASSLAWLEAFPQADRAAMERRLGRPITQLGPGGKLVRAPRRSRYVVVKQIRTRDRGARSVLGLDLSRDPVRRPVIRAAAASHKVRSTPVVKLANTLAQGLGIYAPAYDPSGRLLGFASGSYRLDLLTKDLTSALPSGTRLRVVQGGRVLVRGGQQEHPLTRRVSVSGQTWVLSVSPAPTRGLSVGLSILLGGLLASALLLFLVREGMRRRELFASTLARRIAERDEAEQSRMFWESRFARSFDAAPIGMAFIDRDGRFERVNAALAEMLGRAPDELLALRADDLSHSEDRAIDFAHSSGPRMDPGVGASERFEKRWLRPDGTEVHTAVSVSVLAGAGGEVTGSFVQLEDITARRDAERRLAESEQHHRLALAHLPGTVITIFDHDLRCILAEGQQLSAQGWDPSEFVGSTLEEIVPPDRAQQLRPLMRRGLAGEEAHNEYTSHRNGRIYDNFVGPYRDEQGTIVGALTVSRDITEEREAQRQAAAAQALFEVTYREAPVAMAILDVEGKIRSINAAFTGLTGYTGDQLHGKVSGPALLGREHSAAGELALRRLAVGRAESADLQATLYTADGSTVEVDLHATCVRTPEGEPDHFILQALDVSAQKRSEEELRFLANHDALTGLLNRRSMSQELERHAARVNRYGAEGALVVLDIDHFKEVNDSFGHHVGDLLIQRLGEMIGAELRATDLCARLGGDEFAVLLHKADEAEAEAVAQKLVEGARRMRVPIDGEHRGITISAGVAMCVPRTDLDAESLTIEADLAMYRAKQAGRDGYTIVTGSRFVRSQGSG